MHREIVDGNLQREKRKQDWHKLSILVKEQVKEEKIKGQKEH